MFNFTQGLHQEKARANQVVQRLQKQSDLSIQRQMSDMKHLTTASRGTIEKLETMEEKGIRILKLALNCRKLMRPEEIALMTSHTTVLDTTCGRTRLDRIWSQVSATSLQCEALSKQRSKMVQENAHLTKMLQHYLSTLATSSQQQGGSKGKP
uniref:Uncharacterized protein n=1 Tax=Cacopsylla melanoneura TaxID=428564 RepID=A0A8D8R5X2_9HEMI